MSRKEEFSGKGAREEKEYFDGIPTQMSAEDELAYAKQLRVEAKTHRQKLEIDTKGYYDLQAQRGALFDSIFAGYMPEFSDEDVKENASNASCQHISGVNQNLEREQRLLYFLGQIVTKLSQPRGCLENAYSIF